MYDMSPNSRWNVVYELGDFWDDNSNLNTMCADYLNETWWAMTASDEEEVDDAEDNSLYQFVSDQGLHSTHRPSISVVVVMLIGMAVMALLRWCTATMRGTKMAESVDAEAKVYGAI